MDRSRRRLGGSGAAEGVEGRPRAVYDARVGEEKRPSAPPKWLSVPGLVAVAVLGAAMIIMSRLFGTEYVVRQVATELIASFGSAVLLLAVFGLLFRGALKRVLRRAPGGETLAQSVQRLGEVLHTLDRSALGTRDPEYEAKLDRVAEDVRTLVETEVPALKREVARLRALLADSGRDE